MRRRAALATIFAVAALLAHGVRAEDAAIGTIRATPAGAFATGLPTAPFDVWLRRELPRSASVLWQSNDCGEQTCVGVRIELPSRDRVIDLVFALDPPAFVTGVMDSPSATAPLELANLGALPGAMGRSLALLGLGCLEGDPEVERVYAGSTETCYRGEVPDGPYRSWFHTGLYLMAKGSYRDGMKVDRWIDCDRFERCQAISYDETGSETARTSLGSEP